MKGVLVNTGIIKTPPFTACGSETTVKPHETARFMIISDIREVRIGILRRDLSE
jgi:hypothetical protein